jgi:gluconokinase
VGRLRPKSDLSPIVVMGVSGCGKTTVGCALAARLNATFLDADDFHPDANIAKMRAETPLDDEDRAPWLAALNDELHAYGNRGDQVVLACSALKKSYRDAISSRLLHVQWIFLDGSYEQIAARLRERVNHYMPESLLRSQFDALERPENAITISIALRLDQQIAVALQALCAAPHATTAPTSYPPISAKTYI